MLFVTEGRFSITPKCFRVCLFARIAQSSVDPSQSLMGPSPNTEEYPGPNSALVY